ncbi:hypothetical protein SLS56_008067 [Neofusicoccum ribis]|uniref:Heterokaryon incompatibility domain-containing protein n=1 Tax=Neofusicoccum ribis TaxID=45134 RepID=A0ABR3SL75_9PEZI
MPVHTRKRKLALIKAEDEQGDENQRDIDPDDQELCSNCSKIDFDQVFGQYVRSSQGKFVADIGCITPETRGSQCPLCRLIAETLFYRPRPVLPSSDAHIYLKAVSAAQSLSGFDHNPRQSTFGQLRRNSVLRICWRTPDNQHFSIQDEHLAPTTPSPSQCPPPILCRRLSPTAVPFPLLRTWLHNCHTLHLTHCPRPNTSPPFPSFRLIDCHRRIVVPAPPSPHCSYAALSYVWGPADRDAAATANSKRDPLTSNPAIADAVTATLGLGLTYLWVDALCINQSSPADKALQISRMDAIYRLAAVTLIAAGDPHPGLPGTHPSRPRTTQPAATIPRRGGAPLVVAASLREPQRLARASRWASRAWTYQEAALSPRRLLFTADQALWECASATAAEAVALPAEACHTRGGDALRAELGRAHAALFDLRGARFLDRELVAFSAREMSFQADALNAVRGTLAWHEAERAGVMAGRGPVHVWGVPAQVHWPGGAGFENGRLAGVGAAESARLVARMDFLRGLCWCLDRPGVRRAGFPSWSWAGWVGRLSGQSWERRIGEWVEEDASVEIGFEVVRGGVKAGDGAEAEVVVVDGDVERSRGVVGVEQLRRADMASGRNQVRLSKFLHATASFVELEVVPAASHQMLQRRKGRTDQAADYLAVLSGRDGALYYSPFFLCERRPAEEEQVFLDCMAGKKWRGIITGYSSYVQLGSMNAEESDRETVPVPAPFIVILKDLGEHFERTGDVDLHFLYTDRGSLSQQAEHVEEVFEGLKKSIDTARIG